MTITFFNLFFSTTSKPRMSADNINKKRDDLPVPELVVSDCYITFEEFCKRTKQLKLSGQWQMTFNESFVRISKQDNIHDLPQIDIFVDTLLVYSVRIYS